MTTNDTYDLLSLLPTTSYTLAYALPLFLVSVVLTFAGCFLILDRTRSFPSSAPVPLNHGKQSPLSWLRLFNLGGGVGGLCGGYAFGVHFTTFLSLLLPNTAPTPPLGQKTFLAVWILSALVCTGLAGKWKYAAISLVGMSGFCALALAVSVIVHPPLLARIILAAIFTPLGTILCLLPFPRYARPALTVASACIGAFGIVMTIALFAHNNSWSNVWDRFWVSDGVGWGSSKEKGLSAAFCFLLCAGLLSDWYLHTRIGENPDEKWDRYLADYTAELPNDTRRAGSFSPFVSLWEKFLGHHGSFAPVVPDAAFTGDADVKFSLPTSPGKLSKQRSIKVEYPFPDPPKSKARLALLRKQDSRRGSNTTRARRTIKFSPDDPDLTESDEEALPERSEPESPASRTDSSATLLDAQRSDDLSLLQPPERRWTLKPADVPEYSDGEEDITSAIRPKPAKSDRASVWPPEFIRRHSVRLAAPELIPPGRLTESPEPLRISLDRSTSRTNSTPSSSLPSAEMTSVPATPSLIRAVERINAAHEEMSRTQSPTAPPSPLTKQERKVSWDVFWSDVKTKAHY